MDKIHPYISGNKWFKLKYNLEEAKKQNKDTLLTFGGAFSNHIAATAAGGKEFGFKTIGIIRGGELSETNNTTLRFAKKCGMDLHFIPREEYKKKDSLDFVKSLQKKFGSFYLLPEGGTNELAIKGASEILSHIDISFDYVCCPVGTGGTLAGIISSLKENQSGIGFSALKDGSFLKMEIEKWLLHFQINSFSNFQIEGNYHFGGYARHTSELLKFISDFEKENDGSAPLTTSIRLEQVYTGKMMFGIYDLIKKNHFPKNSTVIAIHTGWITGKIAPTIKDGLTFLC